MSCTVEYDPVTNIIEEIFAGRVTAEELKKTASERIRLQKQHGTLLVFVDVSRVNHLAAGVFDVHDLPARLYESEKADRATYLALLPPRTKEARETALHYETACVNRGWFVQTFEDRHNAIKWLLEKKPSNKTDAGDGR